jgi:hypothetical protein
MISEADASAAGIPVSSVAEEESLPSELESSESTTIEHMQSRSRAHIPDAEDTSDSGSLGGEAGCLRSWMFCRCSATAQTQTGGQQCGRRARLTIENGSDSACFCSPGEHLDTATWLAALLGEFLITCVAKMS